MKAKRVRFKDSESEPNHPESSRFDVCSAACEASDDPSMQPAASNAPKTSEFLFFKKLKQDAGRSSGRNPPNRESFPVKDSRPSNHSTNSTNWSNLKKDVKSSECVKKSNTGEFGSFLSTKDVTLQSSAMPSKEQDSQRFKCSPLVKTPTRSSLDLFLSSTSNVSVNPDAESQQKDGDIFSSKRLKLMQRISKTLFPDANEVPKECDLVSLLLSRLLPESSQEIQSQNLQSRQPKTKEKLHLDPNIELRDDLNTRKLVKANNDHFMDRDVPAYQSRRFWESLPSRPTIERSDASAARYSDRMLLGHKIGSDLGTYSNNVTYGCGSERFGDGNLITWGNEVFDYSTPSNTSPKNLKDEAYEQFSDDAFDNNWSCRFKDHSHSYEVLTDSFVAANSSSHVSYSDGAHDFNVDIGPQLSLSSWCDSSHVSFEGFRPSALSKLRDCTVPDCVSDFGIRREFCPRLIGWNDDKMNVLNSTQTTHLNYLNNFEFRREFCPRLIGWNTDELNGNDLAQYNMEIELYHPPSFTCTKALQSSPPKLEICCSSSSTRREDPWISPEKRNLLHVTLQPSNS